MIVLVLTSTDEEFEKMEEKQKLPKPKLTQSVKDILISILEKRIARYATTLEVIFLCIERVAQKLMGIIK